MARMDGRARGFRGRKAALVAIAVATLAAGCDPDLTVQKGDAGGSEAGSRPVVDAGGLDATVGMDGGQDEGGVDGGPGEASVPGHVIDGVNDFDPATEKFSSSSPSSSEGPPFVGYVTWDATRLYLGMEGPDVGKNDSKYWVLVYLDGENGSTSGLPYGSAGHLQQPTLPFAAKWHLRWKGDKSYTNSQQYNQGTGQWEDATAVLPVAQASNGSFLELSVSRAALGSPSKLKVHINMIVEAPPSDDWSYAAVPATSFTDGFDRDYTRYFEFDLASPQAPNAYAPLP